MMTTIDEFFDDQGPLAAVHPRYRKRSEQLRLATSVGAKFVEGEFCELRHNAVLGSSAMLAAFATMVQTLQWGV